jgi:hypothetical protein
MREKVASRLNRIRSYFHGTSRSIYVPKRATTEYKMLVAMSKVNMLPLVVDSYGENLFVEGYRPARQATNAGSWDIWQANRLDARQTGIYKSALTYGSSYATILPGQRRGKASAVVTPYSALQLTTAYEDPVNDEWPVYALSISDGFDRATRKPVKRVVLYDDTSLYHFTAGDELESTLAFDRTDAHDLSITPVVRWQAALGDLDSGSCGIVEPLIELQDQIDNTTFGLLIAQQYAAFKQRWATGMAIEEDESGNPKEPFNPGVDRLWQNESPDARFGEFQESNLTYYLDSRQSALRLMSSKAQLPAHALLVSDGITNLSAEALAALEAPFQRQVASLKTSFGESDEQMLRLAAKSSSDEKGWLDESAQVVWRDTESRSLAQVADAWGKIATMLMVPPEALWERLPGVTEQDIARWKVMAAEQAERDAEQLAAMGAGDDGVTEGQPAFAGA